jgi:hypothetical protein
MEAVSGGDGRKTMVEAEGVEAAAEAAAEAEGVSHSGLPSNIQVNVLIPYVS